MKDFRLGDYRIVEQHGVFYVEQYTRFMFIKHWDRLYEDGNFYCKFPNKEEAELFIKQQKPIYHYI